MSVSEEYIEEELKELKQKLQQFENFLKEQIQLGQKWEQEHFLDREQRRWDNGWYKAMCSTLEKFEELLKEEK
jgi:hypothetical protein